MRPIARFLQPGLRPAVFAGTLLLEGCTTAPRPRIDTYDVPPCPQKLSVISSLEEGTQAIHKIHGNGGVFFITLTADRTEDRLQLHTRVRGNGISLRNIGTHILIESPSGTMGEQTMAMIRVLTVENDKLVTQIDICSEGDVTKTSRVISI